MMKKIPLFTTLFIAVSPFADAADKFTLKDGSVIEGSVLSETPEHYLLEIQVTKSIKDERKILKADVVKVDREKLDLTAFESIAKLVPVPDFPTREDYSAKIASVSKFIKAYPSSSKISEAKKILETLKAEEAQIADGATKYNGLIIPKQNYLANAYEFDARALEAKIRAHIAGNQIKPALTLFAELSRDFPFTSSHTALAPAIVKLINAYVAETKELLNTLDSRLKERQVGLDRMPLADRQITQDAINEEALTIEKIYTAEKASQVPWPTITPFHKASMADTLQTAQKELARLTTPPAATAPDGGSAYRDLVSAASSASDPAAQAAAVAKALAAAKAAGIPPRYTAPFEAGTKAKP